MPGLRVLVQRVVRTARVSATVTTAALHTEHSGHPKTRSPRPLSHNQSYPALHVSLSHRQLLPCLNCGLEASGVPYGVAGNDDMDDLLGAKHRCAGLLRPFATLLHFLRIPQFILSLLLSSPKELLGGIVVVIILSLTCSVFMVFRFHLLFSNIPTACF